MNLSALLLLLSPVVFWVNFSLGQPSKKVVLAKFISRLEEDAIELARIVEGLYGNRCDGFRLCSRANYDHCQSRLPSTTCPGGPGFSLSACVDSECCSSLNDFTTSTVRIPYDLADGPSDNPTDPQVIETVCFTRKLDEYLARKFENADREYWDVLGIAPSSMYFGSRTGAFRILPGRPSNECGSYDPRVRPWYVAGSSGPKNVVMILDTSGSMEGLRLTLLKKTAKRVVETLAIGDRIAVVPFSDVATEISDDGYVYVASERSKQILISEIDKLGAEGGTNFLGAFNVTFNILDRSAARERTVGCNSAILFLTDGKMTSPLDLTEGEVVEIVNKRLNETQSILGKPIFLFTYSVSENDDDVDAFPKQLACSQPNGFWSKVRTDKQIVDSLSSYYFLFALGLGENTGFAAWVEPYAFETGKEIGTTVSVPVYDRTKNPHLFVGVVGVDFVLSALDVALNLTNEERDSLLNDIVLASTASCPGVELDLCEMESYRRSGNTAGDGEATCTTNCSEADFVQVEEEPCPGVHDYPRDLWANTNHTGMLFAERACCKVNDNSTTTSNACVPTLSTQETICSGAANKATTVAVLLVCLAAAVISFGGFFEG